MSDNNFQVMQTVVAYTKTCKCVLWRNRFRLPYCLTELLPVSLSEFEVLSQLIDSAQAIGCFYGILRITLLAVSVDRFAMGGRSVGGRSVIGGS